MKIKLYLFKKQIRYCEKICRRCLNENNGKNLISQINDVILPELTELAKIDERTVLPPKDKRFVNSFACAFKVWNWDMKKPTVLYKALMKLNRQFTEL